ncbi:MAG: DUF167 domain-containing protein [Candidatus Thorarchaeota archaeon]
MMPQFHMDGSGIWKTNDGVFLKVLVRPKSTQKQLISDVNPDVVVVNLKSPAREGKANAELLKRMSKVLGISTGNIKLVSGHKSREKTLLITGLELEVVRGKVAEIQKQTDF